jgi:cardiolipin synthase
MPGHDLLLQATHDADLVLRAAGLLLVPSVLLRRKEPSSTIAWILVLLLLPALGAILYLLFGRDRVRWPARRKRQLDAVVREQVRDVDPRSTEADRTSHLTVGSSLEQGLFRVAQHLTHLRATSGNRVDVLAHGGDAYDAIGEAIDAARHHVHAQYYLIRDDATGAWFRERLVASSRIK